MAGDMTLAELLAALDHRFSRVAGNERMDYLKGLFRELIQREMGEPDGR
jgi:hypothetical protein